jgi:threonine/homoserine/homoserine lactone efflux protein
MAAATSVSFLAGMVFGLALAAPPGPMNAIIAEESVISGWFAGFRAGLGAMTADLIFFVLAYAGLVTLIEDQPTVRAVMISIGGLLMLVFAADAARGVSATLRSEDAAKPERGFSKALVLGLTNPYQILFWLTVGIGLLAPGTIDLLSYAPYAGDAMAGYLIVQTGSVALVVGLFAGIVVWICSFPATLVVLGDRVDEAAPAVAAGSALVLVGFGVLFLWNGLTTLI